MPKNKINLTKNSVSVRSTRQAPDVAAQNNRTFQETVSKLGNMAIEFQVQKEKTKESAYFDEAKYNYNTAMAQFTSDVHQDNSIDPGDKSDALAQLSENAIDSLVSGSPYEGSKPELKSILNDKASSHISKSILRNTQLSIQTSVQGLENQVKTWVAELSDGQETEQDFVSKLGELAQAVEMRADSGIITEEHGAEILRSSSNALVEGYLTGLFFKDDAKGIERQLNMFEKDNLITPKRRIYWKAKIKELTVTVKVKKDKFAARNLHAFLNGEVNAYSPSKIDILVSAATVNASSDTEKNIYREIGKMYRLAGDVPGKLIEYLENFKHKDPFVKLSVRRVGQTIYENYERASSYDPKTYFGGTAQAKLMGNNSDKIHLTVPQATELQRKIFSGEQQWYALPDKIKASLVAHKKISAALNQSYLRGEDVSPAYDPKFYIDLGRTLNAKPKDVKFAFNKHVAAVVEKWHTDHKGLLAATKKYNGSQFLGEAYGLYLKQYISQTPGAANSLKSEALAEHLNDKLKSNFYYNETDQIIIPIGQNPREKSWFFTDFRNIYNDVSEHLRQKKLEIDGPEYVQKIANSGNYARNIGVNSTGELFVYLKKGKHVVPVKLKGYHKYMTLEEFLRINKGAK